MYRCWYRQQRPKCWAAVEIQPGSLVQKGHLSTRTKNNRIIILIIIMITNNNNDEFNMFIYVEVSSLYTSFFDLLFSICWPFCRSIEYTVNSVHTDSTLSCSDLLIFYCDYYFSKFSVKKYLKRFILLETCYFVIMIFIQYMSIIPLYIKKHQNFSFIFFCLLNLLLNNQWQWNWYHVLINYSKVDKPFNIFYFWVISWMSTFHKLK